MRQITAETASKTTSGERARAKRLIAAMEALMAMDSTALDARTLPAERAA